MNHRDRLIAQGLFSPLDVDVLYQRKQLLNEKNVLKNSKCDLPNCIVFRRDSPFKHIILDGVNCCQSAFLIQDYLYYYEANRICCHLNSNDSEQPLVCKNNYYIHMYGIATIDEWNEWLRKGEQLIIG